MKETIIEALSKEIPEGDYCNPDRSLFPIYCGPDSKNCPYHAGIYCDLHEEMVGNDKICGINNP